MNWYQSTVSNKEEAIQAINKKVYSLTRELEYFKEGLHKIGYLKENEFYELNYNNNISFVQCKKFGRDHVDFRIYASQSLDLNSIKSNGNVSLSWGWNWKTKPVSKEDAPLYVGCNYKSKQFEKLLRKGCVTK